MGECLYFIIATCEAAIMSKQFFLSYVIQQIKAVSKETYDTWDYD